MRPHFSTASAVLRNVGRVKCHNAVTTGTGTKYVLKLKFALRYLFSIQSSNHDATSVAKVSLFST